MNYKFKEGETVYHVDHVEGSEGSAVGNILKCYTPKTLSGTGENFYAVIWKWDNGNVGIWTEVESNLYRTVQ